MRISFSLRAVPVLALAIFAITGAASRAADKPVDVDAELAAALEAWSLKATPRDSYYEKKSEMEKAYQKGFRDGIALLLKHKPVEDDYRGPDRIKRARDSGMFQASRTFVRGQGEVWQEIAKRLRGAPDQRVGNAREALALAVEVGGVEDVTMLLDRGADIEGQRKLDNSRPLHLAAGNAQQTALLLKRGAKPNTRDAKGQAPLHLANYECLKLLVEHGADVTLADDLGRTPLHVHTPWYRSSRANEAVVLLLKHKADASARDKTGSTPLHVATDTGTAAFLLKHGAKVNATNKVGNTPLHVATSAELVDFLIQQGGSVKAVNDQGDTPLHTAPTYQAVIALLKHGPDLSAANKKGKRPADVQRVARVLAYKEAHGQLPSDLWGHAMSKLDDTLPASFDDNKLINVLDYIRNTTGLNMYIDWNAIEAHTEIDTPITHAAHDSPAGEILSAVLEKAAKGKFTWQIDPHGILLISTPPRMKTLIATQPPSPPAGGDAPPLPKSEQPGLIHFDLNELEGVFKSLKDTQEFEINADWSALEKAGIKRDALVTLMLNNVAIYRSVELIVFDATAGKAVVKKTKNAIYVSTPDAIDAFMKK